MFRKSPEFSQLICQALSSLQKMYHANFVLLFFNFFLMFLTTSKTATKWLFKEEKHFFCLGAIHTPTGMWPLVGTGRGQLCCFHQVHRCPDERLGTRQKDSVSVQKVFSYQKVFNGETSPERREYVDFCSSSSRFPCSIGEFTEQ